MRLLATGRPELFTEVVGESSLAEQSLEASSVSDLERLWVAMMNCCGCCWVAVVVSVFGNDPAVRVYGVDAVSG